MLIIRSALNPNPGWRPFQRLNRSEYRHAVKDLTGRHVVAAQRDRGVLHNAHTEAVPGKDVVDASPSGAVDEPAVDEDY